MYFVIVTGIPKGDESYISMVDTRSAKGAHDIAISEFRRKRDIPSNIHVHSTTAFRSNDLGEASSYYKRLTDRIAAAEEAMKENDERRTG